MPYLKIHIPCPALFLNAPLNVFIQNVGLQCPCDKVFQKCENHSITQKSGRIANFLLTQGAGFLQRGVKIFLGVDKAFKEGSKIWRERDPCIKAIEGGQGQINHVQLTLQGGVEAFYGIKIFNFVQKLSSFEVCNVCRISYRKMGKI